MSDWTAPSGPPVDDTKPLNRKQRRAALQNSDWNDKGRTDPRAHTEKRETARQLAFDVLQRIENDGAYANLVLGPTLAASNLSDQDRRFATELVYGSTRMRRACDAIIDRFVSQPPDDATRSLLRLRCVSARVCGGAGARRGQRDRGTRAG